MGRWETRKHSIVTHLGGAISAIALLAMAGMLVSGMVTFSTQGSGIAINLAGSLRMESWHMATLYLSQRCLYSKNHQKEMEEAIERFDDTLKNPSILAMLQHHEEPSLHHYYEQVETGWMNRIRPLMLTSLHRTYYQADNAVTISYVYDFVGNINDLVKRMEHITESQIFITKIILSITLIVTIFLVIVSIYIIYINLVRPLNDLLTCAIRVGQGDLTVRTQHVGDDELGRLGVAFNRMNADLQKLYQNMEAEVTLKTAELTRSNHSLEWLYRSIAKLQKDLPQKETYIELLKEIESLLGLGHGIICLSQNHNNLGKVIASTLQPEEIDPCHLHTCQKCCETTEPICQSDHDHKMISLPLADSQFYYGRLIVNVPQGYHPEIWQLHLLETLSHHIGISLGIERRIEQGRRLALLEERALIARELHDSLAQSLAYMRIQVSRLQAARKHHACDNQEEEAMLQELREGLASSYRELRELLSTFRLKIQGEDLSTTLIQTIDEFSQRDGFIAKVEIDRCPFTPHEEIHILHIVREALSNVVNHAQAHHVQVTLHYDKQKAEVTLMIEDDGIGMLKAADTHHYGMAIMEERALALHGTIRYRSSPQKGTQVILTFSPSSKS